MRIELRADQAARARDGLLKSLYGLAFGWVVAKINTAMRRDGGGAAYVGGEGDVYVDALDIFGFENFEVNSFEQLCINFANEKLHQLFLYAMFKAEHEVIALEKVSLPPVDYADNERCLQMLERAPSGVFHLLDTCCRVNSSPSNFCLQVHAEHAACEFLVLGINGCNEDRAFTVRHFAGDVEYAVDDFLKKNAETMEVMTRQLLAPALAFLQATYDDAEETRRARRRAASDARRPWAAAAAARCSARARRRAPRPGVAAAVERRPRRVDDGASLPRRHGPADDAALEHDRPLCALRQAQRDGAARATFVRDGRRAAHVARHSRGGAADGAGVPGSDQVRRSAAAVPRAPRRHHGDHAALSEALRRDDA